MMKLDVANQSTRDLTADLAKGIGIILVLIGHTPTAMTTWIYAVHMPLFVFMSGWFYKKRSVKEEFFKGYRGLIIPWMIFCVTNFIVAASQVLLTTHQIDNIAKYIFPISDYSYVLFQTIWFLPCLFLVRGFYNLIYNACGSKSIWIAILCYVAAFLLNRNNINLPFFIDSALGLIIFYALGNAFAQSWRVKGFFLDKKSTVRPIVITIISGGGILSDSQRITSIYRLEG